MNPHDESLESPPPPTATTSAEPNAPEHVHPRVSELRMDATGTWELRSASHTVLLLDLDRGLLMRKRGSGSPHFDYDNVWVPLVGIASSRGDRGVIRVGDRHEFLTDPAGGAHDYRWLIPRTCTEIVAVPCPTAPSGSEDGQE